MAPSSCGYIDIVFLRLLLALLIWKARCRPVSLSYHLFPLQLFLPFEFHSPAKSYNDYEGVASSIAFGEPIFRESIWAIANFVSIGDTERVANLRSIFRKVMTEEHT